MLFPEKDERALSAFNTLAANHFLQARSHEEIERSLFPKILGEGERVKSTNERDALIAATSIRYANGDDQVLAQHALSMEVPFEECLVLLRASRLLQRNSDFTHELFNGDARPLVEEALSQAVKSVYHR